MLKNLLPRTWKNCTIWSHWSRFKTIPFLNRTIKERTRRRVIITFHRPNELTTTFELTTARHLFSTSPHASSIIPTLIKTTPKPKNEAQGQKVPIPILSPGSSISGRFIFLKPRLFLVYFWSFQSNTTSFYNKSMWKMSCPSSTRHRDLNPLPLEHESSPTRPCLRSLLM